MNLRLSIASIFFVAIAANAQVTVYDVTKYGAKADGKTDISQALVDTWKVACTSGSPSRVLIPKGTYMLGIVSLSGPCKAPVNLHVAGTVMAPVGITGGNWISFNYMDGFTLSGYGSFDGQGQQAWTMNDCGTNVNCKVMAINLRFNYVMNSEVRDISSVNSKNFHVNVLGCKNLTFQHFSAIAPRTSINTDGIHIGRSSGINITDTKIATGDDCISIGDDSQQIHVTRVQCGPGHGISVGSLGRYPNEKPVAGIFVSDCTIFDADNGVRIKSWPAKEANLATNMHFKNIVMRNVSNPIIIDQMYCPWNQCNNKVASKVQISNVSFKNITGTSFTPVAVTLLCSSGYPCKDVMLSDIDITYMGADSPAKSVCTNVRPTIVGKMTVQGCKN